MRIELGRESAWLIPSSTASIERVLRDKCAHMGNKLSVTKSGFICPSHNWTYNFSGLNDIEENPGLEEIPFHITKSELIIETFVSEYIFSQKTSKLLGNETLELLAHACFLLSTENTNIYFDPWIKGNTYWGSWGHFPKNEIDYSKLKDATHVVITHPHPDHFHPESMELFKRDVEILVPPFPSQILPRVLARMGFENVREVEWETSVELSSQVELAFMRPTTVWEDSAVAVRVADWLWLNQNDSGAPLKDELLPQGIDLLTTSFDAGASGYPLTWEMSDQRKINIISNAKKQILNSIEMRCAQTKAKHFAPFAGWWRHSFIEHQELAELLDHTTLEDIEKVLQETETKFIPTIPSSKINLSSMRHTFEEDVKAKLRLPHETNPAGLSSSQRLSDAMLKKLFSGKLRKLSEMSAATDCESLNFIVTVEDLGWETRMQFGHKANKANLNIYATISRSVAELIACGDETVTWNHIDIAYLARWKRDPDIYPVKFMRLLQLGYVVELATDKQLSRLDIENVAVAEFIEANPEMSRKVLNRAGLPCAACQNVNSESLGQVFEIHKIGNQQRAVVKAELAALLGAKSNN